ncbi:MAG: glutamine--fructose-6-phosphate transaminase (isomerizing) [Eubacteriales bacterium]|nr:glutamine--fructose-6-phosphate transaminase (isomerizing) [Eubacteriales bacterium]
MCGIVGYIGNRQAAPLLLAGLEKLEYRGYDSAGIAVLENGAVEVVKCKGRLSALAERLGKTDFGSTLGIGHTRWATHGEPNDLNSHPHISRSGKIAVVHNGIIENYIELKRFLIARGYSFISETDTEVIAHLIEYHYKGDLRKAVTAAMTDIEGSYALGVICSEQNDMFVAARKDSPLIAGIGGNEYFIASDIPAILEHTRDIYILEDKEIAVISRSGAEIFDIYGGKVVKEVFRVNWDIDAAEKSGYEHFMIKEICEEPKVVRDTISPRIRGGDISLDGTGITAESIREIDKIFIVACGTAYHAGVIGKYVIEKLARIPVETELASEFRYRDPMVGPKTLVIVISQSGETLDTMMALKESKRRGARVLSIVNVVGSSIARESDNVLYTQAGPEIAVASTKAYNAQLSAIYLIALKLAQLKGTVSGENFRNIVDNLLALPKAIEKVLGNRSDVQKYASLHYNAKSIFFIGRGLDYALSMEGSLKLKEISYIHSEAYAGGELKHGTIALIEEGTLVVCPMTQLGLREKMTGNIREVKARGAVVLAVVPESCALAEGLADHIVRIPDIDPLVAPVVAATVMQLFAYYVAVLKGCDVDKPRNLAKSVTVE